MLGMRQEIKECRVNEALIKDTPLPLRRLVIAYFIRGHSTRDTSKHFSMPLEQVEELIRWRLRPERYALEDPRGFRKPQTAKTPRLSRLWAGSRPGGLT